MCKNITHDFKRLCGKTIKPQECFLIKEGIINSLYSMDTEFRKTYVKVSF